MSPRANLHAPPPPAPSCVTATGDAAHAPDPRPASVRLGNPRLRRALLGYVLGCQVPKSQAEDVLQRAFENAWNKRDRWPATPFEFERWMFTLAYRRSIDAHRAEARRPVVDLRDERDEQRPASEEADDEDFDPAPMVSPAKEAELREGLRLAAEAVEQNPTWKRAFGWMMRTLAGESYADIAERDAVTEETVKSAIKNLRGNLRKKLPDVAKLLVVGAVLLFLYGAWQKHRTQEAKPGPKPVPSVVAPSPAPAPSPVSQAKDLRDQAKAACDDGDWDTCAKDLAQARKLDPDGDDAPEVQALYARITSATAPHEKKMR